MWDHQVAAHGGDPHVSPEQDYKFSLASTHRDPLSRQLTEACRIQRALGAGVQVDNKGVDRQVVSLNRKYEYFAPRQRVVRDRD